MSIPDVTDEQLRHAGFTAAARQYPLTALQFIALCAFNGVTPENAPTAWRFAPNESARDAWERVVIAMKRQT